MIKIVVDSGSNFTKELLDKYDVAYLKTDIILDGKVYPSSLAWDNISPDYLVNFMAEGGLPEISQPSVGRWVDEINEILKEDKDIAYLAMSSNLAGAVKSFNIAKKLIKTDRRMEVFEINGAAATIELIVLEVLKNLTENTTFEDIENQINDLNSKVHFYGLPESMRQWAFSGRAQGKKDFTYPQGYPIMKGRQDGTIRPLGVYSSFEESLEAFKNDIKGFKAEHCVLNYIYGTYIDWIKKVENIIVNDLGCSIISKNIHGPTCTCVGGVNSVDVAFI